MSTPRVSAIIVSYNRPQLLRRAIDSALAQTVADKEVIIVDNCSDSFDPFKELADYGDRIRILRNTGNNGCGNARNFGVKHAKGEFVAFLDDDDRWFPQMMQRHLDTIGACVMSASGQEYMIKTGVHIEKFKRVTPKMLRFGNGVCPPSGFFCRRDLFDRITFDDAIKYAEDWDFLIRAIKLGEINYVPEALIYYTVNTSGSSMTSASKDKTWDQIQYQFATAEKHRAFLGETLYRRRVAKITLANIVRRRNKLEFIGHSLRKAGLPATALFLAQAATEKARSSLGRFGGRSKAT